MIFQKKVDRAMKHSHDRAKAQEGEGQPDLNPEDIMEKGDLPAMMLAGMVTILPVALVVLGILVLAGYFFLMR